MLEECARKIALPPEAPFCGSAIEECRFRWTSASNRAFLVWWFAPPDEGALPRRSDRPGFWWWERQWCRSPEKDHHHDQVERHPADPADQLLHARQRQPAAGRRLDRRRGGSPDQGHCLAREARPRRGMPRD